MLDEEQRKKRGKTVKRESLYDESHMEKLRLISFSFMNHSFSHLDCWEWRTGVFFFNSRHSILTSAPSNTSAMKENTARARSHHPSTWLMLVRAEWQQNPADILSQSEPNHGLALAFRNKRAPCEDTSGFSACLKAGTCWNDCGL